MQSRQLANALVLLGSSALLGGALLFQHIGGYAPCEMCIWQRWPHFAAIVIGLVAWSMRSRPAAVALAALATLVSGLIGVFHAGVELHLWTGPTACSATLATGDSAAIQAQIFATPMIRCDTAAWSLFHISMAGWNAIFSLAIAGSALWLLKRR